MPTIAVLPGDGIGPEVVAEAVKVLTRAVAGSGLSLTIREAPIGGSAYEATGHPLPDDTLRLAQASDAILFGAVGGPKWDTLPRPLRAEQAILTIRKSLDLYANLRPACLFPALVDASTLKREVVEGTDLLVVRELTSGLYFGEPKGITGPPGAEVGVDTLRYTRAEIARVGRVAFRAAQRRRRKLTSVDKYNVLASSELWRRVVTEVAAEFPDVTCEHMLADTCAMQLVRAPRQFDVILAENTFGDLLSDETAMLVGSLGMLPSASLGDRGGLYEPIHGSAPDIAGTDQANPLAAILSAALMLRHTFDQSAAADRIERAVREVLDRGFRTRDIHAPGMTLVGTRRMGDLVVEAVEADLSM